MRTKLSAYHRKLHAGSLAIAKTMRHDGGTHARMMELAKVSRFYFVKLRSIGD